MTTLQGFPLVSQFSTVTGDGRPSENSQFNCVPASIDAACRWLLGKPENSIFDADNFKDAAYGEALRNSGTAAFKYVEFCKSLGVHLYPFETDNYAHAIANAHLFIREQKPVIFTRDDPYVDRAVHPDWTHVCVFKEEDASGLTALDPYIGKPVYKTDAGWESVLRNSELWIAERIEEVITIDLNNPEVAKYYEPFGTGSNQWKCKIPNAKGEYKVIQYAILDFYRHYGNAALCGLSWLGLPLSNEVPISGIAGAVRQNFERGVLIYDPTHKNDNPPGVGSVYLAHLYDNGPGSDPRIAELTAKVADLTKQLASAPNNTALQQQLDAVNAKLAQFKALAASM